MVEFLFAYGVHAPLTEYIQYSERLTVFTSKPRIVAVVIGTGDVVRLGCPPMQLLNVRTWTCSLCFLKALTVPMQNAGL